MSLAELFTATYISCALIVFVFELCGAYAMKKALPDFPTPAALTQLLRALYSPWEAFKLVKLLYIVVVNKLYSGVERHPNGKTIIVAGKTLTEEQLADLAKAETAPIIACSCPCSCCRVYHARDVSKP